MDIMDWAEKEVEIACKRENPDRKDGEWDYGCACYESALKAYKCLLEDEHSGFSFSMTKHILNRLMDSLPLTPIEDTDDAWGMVTEYNDGRKDFQCKRMPSLFKEIDKAGNISYSNVDRYYCVEINNPDITFYSPLVTKTLNKMFPITMPYWPSKSQKVEIAEFLADEEMGDFDTVAILRLYDEDKIIDINKFFKEDKTLKEFVEIDYEEYKERYAHRIK